MIGKTVVTRVENLAEDLSVSPHFPTSRPGRFLLLGTVVLMPLQDTVPSLAGFSILFILFAVLAGSAVLKGPHLLDRVWMHPVFIATYAFICLTGLIEFTSPQPGYDDILRFGLMICGAVLVAALCRDSLALKACLYGYMGAALWLGIVVMLTSYGTLSGMEATDYDQASQIRVQAFKDVPLRGNLNGMAFSCSQGGVAALAFALAGLPRRRTLFLAIALFCLIASFFPMSRGGIAITILSSAVVLYAFGIKQAKVLIFAGFLGAAIALLVPQGIWSRMVFSTEVYDGKMEVRAAYLVQAVERLPDYFITGVGAGNCMSLGDWSCYVHNSFLHVTIYWGVTGLLALIIVIWQGYRCIPERCGRDALALGVLGIAASSLLLLVVMHNFYDKTFSFVLGMLVASKYWIWPNGAVQYLRQDKAPPHFSPFCTDLSSFRDFWPFFSVIQRSSVALK